MASMLRTALRQAAPRLRPCALQTAACQAGRAAIVPARSGARVPAARALSSLLSAPRTAAVAAGASRPATVPSRRMGDAAAGGSEKDQYIQSWLPRAEVKERVLGVVKGFPKVDQAKVSETASFKELGLDSLDSVELVMALEEEFALEIPDAEADKMLTVADAINYFSHAPNAK